MNDPENLDEYENQLDDVDLKALLAQQNAYLHAIYTLLSDSAQARSDDAQEGFECAMCDESFSGETPLRSHAQEVHKAPADMALENLTNP